MFKIKKQVSTFSIPLLSIALIVISSLVIVGWFGHNKNIVQIIPDSAPMQMNTALCFLLSSIALLLYRHKFIAHICASLVGFISLLTLIEYIFTVNLGIDNLIIEPFITSKTSHAGRMAPNTALSFLFFTLFVFSNQINFRKFWFILALLPCSYGILGAISLTGYALNMEQAYAWGTLTHMAIHTSVAFIVLSLASILTFYKNHTLTLLQKEIIFDALVFTFVLFFCFIIWLSIRANMVNRVKDETENFLNLLSSQLVVKVESEVEAIIRIFSRYHLNAYANSNALKTDAEYYFQHMPFLINLNLNSSQEKTANNFINPMANRYISHLVRSQCRTFQYTNTNPDILEVHQLFIANTSYLCITQHQLLATINLSDILNTFIENESEKYSIFISEANNKTIASHNRIENQAFLKFWSYNNKIDMFSNTINISVSPRQIYIKQILGRFPYYMWLLSLLLSIVVLLIVKNKRQLMKKDKALKLSESANYTLLNSVGESIIGVDIAHKVTFMNYSAQRLLGVSFSTGYNIYLEDILKNDIENNTTPIIDYVKKTFKTARVQKKDIEYIKNKINEYIPISFSISPIIKDQIILGVIIVLFDITKRIKEEEHLKKIAYYDSLTKLPNRFSIFAQLEKALSHAQKHDISFALCFIDVNKFKSINDTYGHHAGDKALQFVAEQLRKNIREDDFLGRFAGDEFCLILNNVKETAQVESIIEKLKRAFSKPFHYKRHSFLIEISLGYAVYSEGISAQELLVQADKAMYENKRSS